MKKTKDHLENVKHELRKRKVFSTFVEGKGWSIFGLDMELPEKLHDVYDVIEEEVRKGEGLIVTEVQFLSDVQILLSDEERKIRLETVSIISRIPTIMSQLSKELNDRLRKEKDTTIKAFISWILTINLKLSTKKAIELIKTALAKEQQSEMRFELLLKLAHFEGLNSDAEKTLTEMVKKRELKEWQYSEYQLKIQELIFYEMMKEQHENYLEYVDIVNTYLNESMDLFKHILDAKESYDKLPKIEKIKRQADELLIQFNKEQSVVPEIESKMNVLSQYIKIKVTSKDSLFKRWGGEIIGALVGVVIGGVITFLITYFLT